jgi:putative flavoprotein involved in K+ transport
VHDVTYDSLEDKAVTRTAQPQVSGLGRYCHTVSLQHLARQGAVILGRLLDVAGSQLILNDDAAAHVHFADQFSQTIKDNIDAYLVQSGMTPPPLEDDPANPEAGCVSPLRRRDLREVGVGVLIWATGYTSDFSWIHLPVLDAEGSPIFQRGISPLRGLYFIGFPWLSTRKSGIIYGIDEDAHYIAGTISAQVA